MVSKITAGDTLDGDYGVIGLHSLQGERKSNFIVDWFGWFAPKTVGVGGVGFHDDEQVAQVEKVEKIPTHGTNLMF